MSNNNLQQQRLTNRPERIDTDVAKRASMIYLYTHGFSQQTIANMFNVSKQRVSQIVNKHKRLQGGTHSPGAFTPTNT